MSPHHAELAACDSRLDAALRPAAVYATALRRDGRQWAPVDGQSLILWMDDWLTREPDGLFVMACGGVGGPEARARTLTHLMSLMQAAGVPAQQLHYTDERMPQLEPPVVATANVQLRVVSALSTENPVPLRTLFDERAAA